MLESIGDVFVYGQVLGTVSAGAGSRCESSCNIYIRSFHAETIKLHDVVLTVRNYKESDLKHCIGHSVLIKTRSVNTIKQKKNKVVKVKLGYKEYTVLSDCKEVEFVFQVLIPESSLI